MAEQPKRPKNGYQIFTDEHRPEFMAKLPGQSVAAVSKLAGETWKGLAEAERAKYEAKAKLLKEQYEKDLQAFKDAGGEVKKRKAKQDEGSPKKGRRTGGKKDPNAPKKPVGGAYGVFLSKHRAEIQKECSGGKCTQVAKIAGERWKALSDAEKKSYEIEYQEKKAAYLEASKAYKEKGGAAGTEDAAGASSDEEEEHAG